MYIFPRIISTVIVHLSFRGFALISKIILRPGLPHEKPRCFTSVHRVVIVLENEVLHQVVLRHAFVTHRAVVTVGLTVALESGSTSWRGQPRHGAKQGRHEHQPEQHKAAAQPAEEARAGTVLREP